VEGEVAQHIGLTVGIITGMWSMVLPNGKRP
jgi:hypothetical protein